MTALPPPVVPGSSPLLASPAVLRLRAEQPLTDVMDGCSRLEVRVHQHGFIALIDAMPRLVPLGQTADWAVVQAARVSYGPGTRRVHEDRALIRYLLRHRHTTPFEMVEFKFHVAMPVFVARQWIRHRTANVNEQSGRYSIIPEVFYRPSLEDVRRQSTANRQGGDETFVPPGTNRPDDEAAARNWRTAEQFLEYLRQAEALYENYARLAEAGVAREMARIGLPLSVYTQWYWKCDLHNILHFLSLRMDSHAQKEIRDYACAMYALLEPIVPATMEAWRDYEFQAMRLTRLEIEALRDLARGGSGELASPNARERAEWDAKRRALGLEPRPTMPG